MITTHLEYLFKEILLNRCRKALQDGKVDLDDQVQDRPYTGMENKET